MFIAKTTNWNLMYIKRFISNKISSNEPKIKRPSLCILIYLI